jgi:hypothetical protein
VSRLVFVDRAGGALASLCASIARSYGLRARAESMSALVDRPEIVTVLAEIGVSNVVVATVQKDRDVKDVLVDIGPDGLDLALYDGPAKTNFGDASLERLSCARISRDRIERWLDALPNKAAYSASQSLA